MAGPAQYGGSGDGASFCSFEHCLGNTCNRGLIVICFFDFNFFFALKLSFIEV